VRLRLSCIKIISRIYLLLLFCLGNSEIIELLVKKGEDPDECGYFGMTPLMLAAFESHPAAVDALLRVGAEVNRSGRMGGYALCKVCCFSQ